MEQGGIETRLTWILTTNSRGREMGASQLLKHYMFVLLFHSWIPLSVSLTNVYKKLHVKIKWWISNMPWMWKYLCIRGQWSAEDSYETFVSRRICYLKKIRKKFKLTGFAELWKCSMCEYATILCSEMPFMMNSSLFYVLFQNILLSTVFHYLFISVPYLRMYGWGETSLYMLNLF